jgi:hypothetical protein
VLSVFQQAVLFSGFGDSRRSAGALFGGRDCVQG